MKAKTALRNGVALMMVTAVVFTGLWGCGDDFLGLEDYQRDLITGGLIAAALLNQQQPAAAPGDGEEPAAPIDGRDGVDGADGLSCWDLDGDGLADPDEDSNGDGDFTALDCQGPAGLAGADGAAGQDGAAGPAGEDGLGGLSCWDLNGNRVGERAEDINGDGMFDAYDCRGPAGPPGSPGASGASGPAGPAGADGVSLFSIFIDEFFAAEHLYHGLPVVLVEVREPALGAVPVAAGDTQPYDAVAYRVAIPQIYNAGNDVTMRMYFHRTGPLMGDCFVFRLDARRLRAGSDMEAYGNTLWIRVDVPAIPVPDGGIEENGNDNGDGLAGMFLVVDLPVNTAAGLGFPDDLAPADFLAFELGSTELNDGGLYQILGVEFFESRSGTATRSGATVLSPGADRPCGIVDCNDNGVDDQIDIGEGTSADCNENDVPDECDIAEGTSQDCQPNGIPDECDLCPDVPTAGRAVQQDIEHAVVSGLQYLVAQQQKDGCWQAGGDDENVAGDGGGGECFNVAVTGLVVLKLADRALDLGFSDPMDPAYEYHTQVADGFACIVAHSQNVDISSEPAADGDGDNIGTFFNVCPGNHDNYSTGIAIMALSASGHPELYSGVVQDAVDWMSFAQNNADCGVHRGGWGYGANDCEFSDNSNGGYASLGLGYASASPPRGFGLPLPQFVLDELNLWVDALQDPVNGDADDGGSQYVPGGGWVNILKTGNLLYEMGMVGDTPATQRAQNAIDYIERHWGDTDTCGAAWLNHRQAMFTMMKGLAGLNIDLLDLNGDGTPEHDWFAEVSAHLVATQNADGSWPWDCWGDEVLSTTWALLTLERAVAPPRPTGACCNLAELTCEDEVFEEDCPQPEGISSLYEWTEGVLCRDLDPPCAPPECSLDHNENGIPDECEGALP